MTSRQEPTEAQCSGVGDAAMARATDDSGDTSSSAADAGTASAGRSNGGQAVGAAT
jgi:hypothetical protein